MGSCTFVALWKISLCLFILNCTRNHVIIYTIIRSANTNSHVLTSCVFTILFCFCLVTYCNIDMCLARSHLLDSLQHTTVAPLFAFASSNSFFEYSFLGIQVKGLIVQAGVWKEIKLCHSASSGAAGVLSLKFSSALLRVLCRTPFRSRVFRAFGVSGGVPWSRPAPDADEQLGGTAGAAGWLTDLLL